MGYDAIEIPAYLATPIPQHFPARVRQCFSDLLIASSVSSNLGRPKLLIRLGSLVTSGAAVPKAAVAKNNKTF